MTSAVESFDNAILRRLDKGHTREDVVHAVALCRSAGLTLAPTFVPFTPWTTVEGYREMLAEIERLEIVEHVATIQLALRLLVTAGSPLRELDDVRARLGPFDSERLIYPWRHADARVDQPGGERQGTGRPPDCWRPPGVVRRGLDAGARRTRAGAGRARACCRTSRGCLT